MQTCDQLQHWRAAGSSRTASWAGQSLLHRMSLPPAGSLELDHGGSGRGGISSNRTSPSTRALLRLLPSAKSRHLAMRKVSVGGHWPMPGYRRWGQLQPSPQSTPGPKDHCVGTRAQDSVSPTGTLPKSFLPAADHAPSHPVYGTVTSLAFFAAYWKPHPGRDDRFTVPGAGLTELWRQRRRHLTEGWFC